MIQYLVCNDPIGAASYARSRQWVRVAAFRYATPEKDDIRVVRLFSEMAVPRGPAVKLIRGADFGDNPDWDKFEEFVEAGHGVWVGEADAAPVEASK